MKSLTLENIGPIKEAHLTFGDLTVFVGPQATGKSIALQFLKLVVDKGQILQQLDQYGIDWGNDGNAFLDAYFGEGMHGIWRSDSGISQDSKPVELKALMKRTNPKRSEHAFLVPAQRVLVLRRGWPRPFTDYDAGDPFAVRDFSEKLRVLVDHDFNAKDNVFPKKNRLKNELRDMLATQVFGNFGLRVDKNHSQKRLVLAATDDGDPLPYMVWSAGQREFVPLLLGLYWLLPSTAQTKRGEIDWVMLEEIEMGLHPRAINVVLLMVLDLLKRGYRVCLSTHSPQVLEAIWAIDRLKHAGGDSDALLRIFGAKTTSGMKDLAQVALSKEFRVFYFDRESQTTCDISGLDPDSNHRFEADWGGLSEFSLRANKQVARAVARRGGQP